MEKLALGIVALVVLVAALGLAVARAGREVAPGFMGDVLKSAQPRARCGY